MELLMNTKELPENPKRFTDVVDGGHNILKCQACKKALADIWVTRPHMDRDFEYYANCPYCGFKSQTVRLIGGVHYGGIGKVNPDSETDDDFLAYTVVDSIESVDGKFRLNIKKVN